LEEVFEDGGVDGLGEREGRREGGKEGGGSKEWTYQVLLLIRCFFYRREQDSCKARRRAGVPEDWRRYLRVKR